MLCRESAIIPVNVLRWVTVSLSTVEFTASKYRFCFANCPGVCKSGDLRVVNGANVREGRVEICSDEQWGTICDDSWDALDASVACYQLGYGRDGGQCMCLCVCAHACLRVHALKSHT